jgi:hypothetical protein
VKNFIVSPTMKTPTKKTFMFELYDLVDILELSAVTFSSQYSRR